MSVHKVTVEGEAVTITALPPAWPEVLDKFDRWVAHVERNELAVAGLDVETTAIDEVLGPFEPDARLRLVQFGSRRYGWCLDPHDPDWRPVIEATLRRESMRFVSHTNYDPLWALREFGIDLAERSIDTMPMACLLYPGVTRPKDLKSLSDAHIDGQLSAAEAALAARFRELAFADDSTKGKRTGRNLKGWGFTNISLDDPFYGLYGGLDAVYVRRLLDKLSALLRKTRMGKLSRREQTVARLATSMRVRGQRVDLEWATALLDDIAAEYDTAQRRLVETTGALPTSPRMGEWLDGHGAQFTKRTDTGRPQITMPSASSPGTLPTLVELHAGDELLGPIFADLLVLGQHKNLLTNLRIIVRSARHDGFVHPQINTQAAHTGRSSITKPAMQTFKKNDPRFVEIDGHKYGRLRGCFLARDGYVLVGADYDNQETRIAAALSRDRALRRIVRERLNQHTETAKMIFGSRFVDKSTVMDAITGRTFYDASKVLDFAQQYGAGPRVIGDQLGMKRSREVDDRGEPYANPKARRLWEAWRHAYAGLVQWSEQVAEKRVVVNDWGRRIPSDRWRSYANGNYLIQSTGRDVLGDASVALYEAGWGDSLWLWIHDEIVLEVPEDEAEQAAKALEHYMRAKVRYIELTATAKIIGTRWGLMSE